MATVIIPNFNTQKVYNGLNTYTYTVGSTAMHMCDIKVQHRESSAMTISISQSGSFTGTLATVTLNPSSGTAGQPQTEVDLQALANCVSGDVISFTLTSSASIDEQLNTVQSLIRVSVGTV
jgi:hypothetical protein